MPPLVSLLIDLISECVNNSTALSQFVKGAPRQRPDYIGEAVAPVADVKCMNLLNEIAPTN